MKFEAHIIHQTPGRVRIRVPGAKGNQKALQQIRQAILSRSGVYDVETNSVTGSILILYKAGLLDDLQELLVQPDEVQQVLALRTLAKADESGLAMSMDLFFERLSEAFKTATGQAVGLKEIFPLAIGLYAFFFVDRTIGAPVWLSMIFFSFSAYMDLHESPDDLEREIFASVESLHREIADLRSEIRMLSEKQGTA